MRNRANLLGSYTQLPRLDLLIFCQVCDRTPERYALAGEVAKELATVDTFFTAEIC
jgi:hypothetical protein